MKILKTIVAALLLSVPVASNASVMQNPVMEQEDVTEPTHFILCLNDGEQITFLLEHNPKVVNGDGIITVVDNDITVEYPWDNLHKYIMGSVVESGISYSKMNVGDIVNKAGSIILSGFKEAVPVTVNGVNGISVFKSKTDANGYLMISMSEYPSGIYIIKAGNKTFKFIKR